MYALFIGIGIMISTTAVWLCLIAHVACSTIVTVNNNGNDNNECCKGNCLCSSFSSALKHMQNNTVITITSKVVTLNDIVEMRSGNLNNITITGNGTTIMCNNTGGVYCNSCSNITIRGITWHQCGGKNLRYPPIQTPALNFTTVSNMTIHKCTFQSSSGCPVYIKNGFKSITIKDSYFLDNIFDPSQSGVTCTGLHIISKTNDLNISIISSGFCNSGCRVSDVSNECS